MQICSWKYVCNYRCVLTLQQQNHCSVATTLELWQPPPLMLQLSRNQPAAFDENENAVAQTERRWAHVVLHFSPPPSPIPYSPGSFGSTDHCTISFLHFSLCSAALRDLANSRPVHSLMLPSQLFFYLPRPLPPFTVPCKMVSTRPDVRETCQYHFSLRLFTMARRSSYGPIAFWILAQTSSLVAWSLYEMRYTHYSKALPQLTPPPPKKKKILL